jgi:hypothetical protein
VTVIQFVPDGFGLTDELTVKFNGWPAVVATVTFCEAALLVPPIWKPRFSDAGLTVTGGVGVTVSVTATVRVGLAAGVILIVPLYVPGVRVGTTALLRLTISVVGEIPVVGPTASQPAAELAAAVNELVPDSVRDCEAGVLPKTVENCNDDGLAPMLLTVNDTGTVTATVAPTKIEIDVL